jgi:voltage-gated sodium channel
MTSIQQIQARAIALRDNRAFELFVVGIIILSALLIGAKTYPIPEIVSTGIQWLDIAITFLFLFEIIVRFIAEPNKKRFFHNGWNIFDTLVVVVSLIPIDNSDMALVGRLVRVFRVLRMVSIIPELRMLLNSLVRALPQLGYVVLLMFIIFYIYAAIGATFVTDLVPGDDLRGLDGCDVRDDGCLPTLMELLPHLHLFHRVRLLKHGDRYCGQCIRRRARQRACRAGRRRRQRVS